MSKFHELSEGSLEQYVCQGIHPPKHENIFQVRLNTLIKT